jgi:preprotein translocase subunit SecF
MAFGIVVGTYSSVYQAAPILIWLKVGSHSFVPTEEAGSKAERISEGFGAQP